jgi:hypothetical protein
MRENKLKSSKKFTNKHFLRLFACWPLDCGARLAQKKSAGEESRRFDPQRDRAEEVAKKMTVKKA